MYGLKIFENQLLIYLNKKIKNFEIKLTYIFILILITQKLKTLLFK